jgi:hypothetical protein
MHTLFPLVVQDIGQKYGGVSALVEQIGRDREELVRRLHKSDAAAEVLKRYEPRYPPTVTPLFTPLPVCPVCLPLPEQSMPSQVIGGSCVEAGSGCQTDGDVYEQGANQVRVLHMAARPRDRVHFAAPIWRSMHALLLQLRCTLGAHRLGNAAGRCASQLVAVSIDLRHKLFVWRDCEQWSCRYVAIPWGP